MQMQPRPVDWWKPRPTPVRRQGRHRKQATNAPVKRPPVATFIAMSAPDNDREDNSEDAPVSNQKEDVEQVSTSSF